MKPDVYAAASFILYHRRAVDHWDATTVQREIRRCWPDVTLREAYRAATRLERN